MNELSLIQTEKIRRVYDEKSETWYFSVIDVVGILTDSPNPRKYWSVLKTRLKAEGSQLTTNCSQLKMPAEDGKMRLTDVADPQTMLRIVQSIPSPKAEPIKQWLAKVGYERIKETADPALSLQRARENWQKMGRSEKWIQQRMMGQEIRNKLTDYWKDHEVTKEEEYALLTNMIHQEWSGLSVREHKHLKGLKSQNLRDHMSDAELVFTALAELSTRQIAESTQATGLEENKKAGIKGGRIAKNARLELEAKTGQKVITNANFLPPSKKKITKS